MCETSTCCHDSKQLIVVHGCLTSLDSIDSSRSKICWWLLRVLSQQSHVQANLVFSMSYKSWFMMIRTSSFILSIYLTTSTSELSNNDLIFLSESFGEAGDGKAEVD